MLLKEVAEQAYDGKLCCAQGPQAYCHEERALPTSS